MQNRISMPSRPPAPTRRKPGAASRHVGSDGAGDILQIVQAQHQALEYLLVAVLTRHADALVTDACHAAGADMQTRTALEHAADALALLCGAKEAVLYPAARAAPTDDILLQSLQDHLMLQRLLSGLLHLPAGAAAFQADCGALLQRVRSHQRAEEATLFPAVRQVVCSERLAELGRQLLDYQAGLRQRGRPHLRLLGQVEAVGH